MSYWQTEHKETAADGVTYFIEIAPEDMTIEGNACAIDDDTDAAVASEIRDELESGNLWAWCAVRVRAELDGSEGVDHLGGCSYKDVQGFMDGGYWEDMKSEARADLVANCERAAATLAKLGSA